MYRPYFCAAVPHAQVRHRALRKLTTLTPSTPSATASSTLWGAA